MELANQGSDQFREEKEEGEVKSDQRPADAAFAANATTATAGTRTGPKRTFGFSEASTYKYVTILQPLEIDATN